MIIENYISEAAIEDKKRVVIIWLDYYLDPNTIVKVHTKFEYKK